jgi:nucleotide-binding universal stress UspA family protein
MVLIAYDGSVQANHAITIAGSLLRGGRAHVLHVWEPLSDLSGLALSGVVPDEDEESRAREIAQAGAALARLEGFDADAEAVRSGGHPARTIEEVAERIEPDLIVLGSRGLHGLQAVLKGSVSRHVGSHVSSPVLIVPPAHL